MKFFIIFSIFIHASLQAKILQSVADVAEASMPGVVNIRTTTYVQHGDRQLDLYQFFLNGKVPNTQPTHSIGSGIVIDNEGYVLTNRHVIEDATAIEVLFAKGKKKYSVKVIGSDAKTDIALLQITAKTKLQPLELGNSDGLRIGDPVLAIGNPFGYSHTVTSGIISAKSRVIGAGPYDDFLQTDALIHPGNSGGPLLDLRGRVIGINTAVSREGAGIGFAIPINLAKAIIKDLRAFGQVKRPWVGMMAKNILTPDELETGEDNSKFYGILVTNLVVDGPANRAGIRIGDLVMEVDHHKIEDTDQFQKMINSYSSGKTLNIKLFRRSKGYIKIALTLDPTPKSSELPSEKDLF